MTEFSPRLQTPHCSRLQNQSRGCGSSTEPVQQLKAWVNPRVSLGFGVRTGTFPSPAQSTGGSPGSRTDSGYLGVSAGGQEQSGEPTSLLENLICCFSAKHINQPSTALGAQMTHLANETISTSNKKPFKRRGINMQEGTGQRIITLMTYPVRVLCTLTLRKKGIKKERV